MTATKQEKENLIWGKRGGEKKLYPGLMKQKKKALEWEKGTAC